MNFRRNISTRNILTRIIMPICAILSGLCLFILASNIYFQNTILTSDFHKQLFSKHNIYSHTQSQIKSTIKSFIENNKTNHEGTDELSSILESLQKSTTPEMITKNIDSLVTGLFDYFDGKSVFLPDIYLSPSNITENSNKLDSLDGNVKISYALSKIDKVNLSLILQYINRNDITNSFYAIKLVFYFINILPFFLFCILALFLSAVVFLSRRTYRWIIISLASWSISHSIAGICIILYGYNIISQNSYYLTSSLPFSPEVTIKYIHNCTNLLSAFQFVLSLVIVMFLSLIVFMHKTASPKFISLGSLFNKLFCTNNLKNPNLGKTIKYISCFLSFILVFSLLGYKSYTVQKDFDKNNYGVFISKLINPQAVTKIIPAKDKNIYSLLVKMNDKDDESPIPNIRVIINGQSISGQKINTSMTTNASGEVKSLLDRGSFRINFDAESFPREYQIPIPVFSEIDLAGTTIVTISVAKLDNKE